MKHNLFPVVLFAGALLATSTGFAQLSGNVSVTNNYMWRGLTQSINEFATQGGLDYAADNGMYVGTWISNTSYDYDDVFSYEHDMYFGFAGGENLTYDVGYVYYNYTDEAASDFGETFIRLGLGNFLAQAYFLANAEPDAAPGQDFGAFATYYVAGDYSIPLANGAMLGFHLGYQDGDFSDVFNGVTRGYLDYNVSIAKDGFTFMVTDTNLGDDDDSNGEEDYASMSVRDNDEIKFVVGYKLNFEL